MPSEKEIIDFLESLENDDIYFCLNWIRENRSTVYCLNGDLCMGCEGNVDSDDDDRMDCAECKYKICGECSRDNYKEGCRDDDWYTYYMCRKCYNKGHDTCPEGHLITKGEECCCQKEYRFASKYFDRVKLVVDDIVQYLDIPYERIEDHDRGKIVIKIARPDTYNRYSDDKIHKIYTEYCFTVCEDYSDQNFECPSLESLDELDEFDIESYFDDSKLDHRNCSAEEYYPPMRIDISWHSPGSGGWPILKGIVGSNEWNDSVTKLVNEMKEKGGEIVLK